MTLAIRIAAATALTLATLACGCSRPDAPAAETASPAPTAAAALLPTDLFLAAAPAEPAPVSKIVGAAKPGEAVTVTGRIAGRAAPFVAGNAIFLLADRSLPACSERAGDTCTQPWDLCCETPESKAANLATVQVPGPDGRPLKVDLQDQHGLKALAEITVVGEIAATSTPAAPVINAKGIYVKPS